MSLETEIAGIPLASCIYNASGPRTTTKGMLIKIGESKSGAVLGKSCTLNKQSGNPIFPLLGNEIAGKKAPISSLKARSNKAPIARFASKKMPKIPMISPNWPSETSSFVSVEKISAGTPKFRVSIPTMVVSNGRPERPHRKPIPAITKSGAIMPAICKTRSTS